MKKTFTDEIRNDLTTFVGCISGAIEVDVYKQLLVEAGFSGTWQMLQPVLNRLEFLVRHTVRGHTW